MRSAGSDGLEGRRTYRLGVTEWYDGLPVRRCSPASFKDRPGPWQETGAGDAAIVQPPFRNRVVPHSRMASGDEFSQSAPVGNHSGQTDHQGGKIEAFAKRRVVRKAVRLP